MKSRILLVVVFAACGAVLFFAGRLQESPPKGGAAPAHIPDDGAIARVIDTQFERYHIDKESVRTRRVAVQGNMFARVEQRVTAPSGFLGLVFNHDLNLRLMPTGARVVAIEHSKDNILAMHVVKDHAVVRSIVIALSLASGANAPRTGM